MEEISINYIPIQSLGYVSCNVPSDVFLSVNQEVQDIIKNNFTTALPNNKHLAGLIEHEYKLITCAYKLNKFFKLVIPEYWKLHNNYKETQVEYKIQGIDNTSEYKPDIWVNLQKKYEFNPLHNHRGVLSFVMYLQIPYNMEDELCMPHFKNSNVRLFHGKSASTFSFVYPSIAQQHNMEHAVAEHVINIDKTWVGKMIIFPAWLQHMVTPFYTSDEYRISVSGNLAPVYNG